MLSIDPNISSLLYPCISIFRAKTLTLNKHETRRLYTFLLSLVSVFYKIMSDIIKEHNVKFV